MLNQTRSTPSIKIPIAMDQAIAMSEESTEKIVTKYLVLRRSAGHLVLRRSTDHLEDGPDLRDDLDKQRNYGSDSLNVRLSKKELNADSLYDISFDSN